jgi:hypothetical protein
MAAKGAAASLDSRRTIPDKTGHAERIGKIDPAATDLVKTAALTATSIGEARRAIQALAVPWVPKGGLEGLDAQVPKEGLDALENPALKVPAALLALKGLRALKATPALKATQAAPALPAPLDLRVPSALKATPAPQALPDLSAQQAQQAQQAL